MARKIKLSESIGLQLKEFRTQYRVKGKDVAELIGKSPAYISKLEKGQIQQIDKKELVKITNFISESKEGYLLFCEKIAEKADLKELDNNILLLNFDLMERKLPVSKEIVEIIKGSMQQLNMSSNDLATYINQNEDLGDEFFVEHNIEFNTIEKNVWMPYQEADSLEHPHSFIFLEYRSERIENFINGKIHKCEYMFPFAMLYHLLKALYKEAGKEYNDKLMERCKVEAEEVLLDNQFYSISVQMKVRSQSDTEEEYKKILSSFDRDNREYISQLVEAIQFLSQYDVEYTNEKLEKMVNNFRKCDPSFALAYMAISLEGIKTLQSSFKRDFLNEISSLIEKYAAIANTKDNIEKY